MNFKAFYTEAIEGKTPKAQKTYLTKAYNQMKLEFDDIKDCKNKGWALYLGDPIEPKFRDLELEMQVVKNMRSALDPIKIKSKKIGVKAEEIVNFAIANNLSFEYYTNIKNQFGEAVHPVTHIGTKFEKFVWFWFESEIDLVKADQDYKMKFQFSNEDARFTHRYNQANGATLKSTKQAWKIEDAVNIWIDSCGVVEDENGNKNFYGFNKKYETKEQAQTAIESLQDCKNCIDCEKLRLCFDCINCKWGLWLRNCKDCVSTQFATDCRNLRNCEQMKNCNNHANCMNGKNENGFLHVNIWVEEKKENDSVFPELDNEAIKLKERTEAHEVKESQLLKCVESYTFLKGVKHLVLEGEHITVDKIEDDQTCILSNDLGIIFTKSLFEVKQLLNYHFKTVTYQHYCVYIKDTDMNCFKPVCIATGETVENLMNASIIYPNKLVNVKAYMNKIKDKHPNIKIQLRVWATSNVIFKL